MAALNVRRALNEFEADVVLKGGVRLPMNYKGNERIYGLHTKTLVFSTPAGTVTFADSTGKGLTIQEVLKEINSDLATVRSFMRDGVVFILHATLASAVVIDGATSTARSILGLPNGSITGTKFNPPGGAAPRLLLLSEGASGSIILTTEE
jgi:hypothetical protein